MAGRGRVKRHTAGLLACGLLMACAGLLTHPSKEVRDELMGMRERTLLDCAGAPDDLERLDEEGRGFLWVYLRPLPRRTGQDVEIEADLGGGPAPVLSRGPRVISGDVSQSSGVAAPRRATRKRKIAPGRCELIVELAEGRVVGLESRGRTTQNLNADADCVLLLAHCVR